jgi:cytochrome c-type biogenesis protein
MVSLENFLHNLAINSTVPIYTALLLGMMASLGPCTMTTNITAIAYIGRKIEDRKFAVLASLVYSLGRMITYTLLGALIIGIGIEVPGIRNFLQGIGTYAMGPFLLIVGILMLLVDKLSFRGGNRLSNLSARVSNWGIPGAFLIGVFFAMAFCPYSALLFFAVMIPMAISVREGMVLPASFALGTGLPVIVIGGLLSAGVMAVKPWIKSLTNAQKYVRIAVALVFIVVGGYLILKNSDILFMLLYAI